MQLQRIKDLPEDFPVKTQTLYRWHHERRFPGLLVKLGGALCLDHDRLADALQQKTGLRKVSGANV